jgi:hypothetical protein
MYGARAPYVDVHFIENNELPGLMFTCMGLVGGLKDISLSGIYVQDVMRCVAWAPLAERYSEEGHAAF